MPGADPAQQGVALAQAGSQAPAILGGAGPQAHDRAVDRVPTCAGGALDHQQIVGLEGQHRHLLLEFRSPAQGLAVHLRPVASRGRPEPGLHQQAAPRHLELTDGGVQAAHGTLVDVLKRHQHQRVALEELHALRQQTPHQHRRIARLGGTERIDAVLQIALEIGDGHAFRLWQDPVEVGRLCVPGALDADAGDHEGSGSHDGINGADTLEHLVPAVHAQRGARLQHQHVGVGPEDLRPQTPPASRS